MPESDLLLLPAPRHLTRLGGWSAVPARRTIASALRAPQPWETVGENAAWVVVATDPALPAEAYRLIVTAEGCRITCSTAAGLRHACATLDQLLVQSVDGHIPTLEIADAPAFAVRGAMLDVSRNRIPTMAEFGRIIPLLASWKFNHLQLYVEHTVAYAGHATAWQGLDPLTPAELRALDDLCAAHGIELAANQNCFGHLSGFLKLPRYQHLAEIAVDGTWDFNGLVTRTGPFSLCPSEPAAREFVADLIAQLAPLIRSPWFNIGCDETFDVGQGRSRAAVASRGRAAVYLDFVRQACDLARQHGKRPQFWADIALEHPEALAELPPDLLGLAWGYEPDARFGEWCHQLRGAGREAWVCPGTSSWRSITGRTTERRDNLLVAARDGLAHGAGGFLVTDWGDLGHRQQWPIALHGLAEAAHRAWSGTTEFDARAAGLHGLGTAELGPWLDALGDVDRDLRLSGGKLRPDGTRAALRNATALFTDLHLDTDYIGDAATWEGVDARLADLDRQRPAADSQIDREIAHTVAVARFACRRAAARRRGDRPALHALAGELTALIAEHRALWLPRSRAGDPATGGLANSCAHYTRIQESLACA
jgi:hypothetical protein